MDGHAQGTAHNRDEALKRLGGDEELYRQMIELYLEDAPPLLEQLIAALEKHQASDAERAAHSLKGLSANFSAHDAVAVAAQIETAARGGNLASAKQELPLLGARMNELIDELKAELN